MSDDEGGGVVRGTTEDCGDTNDLTPAFPGPWGSLADAPGSARHDGWTGAVMAQFCEALAQTGIVLEACLAVGRSRQGAYAARHRDIMFAAAWDAALGMARVQLSDALLARSIEGSTESYYRDGELVGEKRYFDNRLGLAVLKRLDRIAETGSPIAGAQNPAVRPEPFHSGQRRRTALSTAPALDWDQILGAMRTRDPEAVAGALAALRGQANEIVEIDTPPDSSFSERDEEVEDASIRVWQDEDGDWWTDFPPPAGFDGDERGSWGDYAYKRGCTGEEAALLDANAALDEAEERAEDETERDSYFADLAADAAAQPQSQPDEQNPGTSEA